MFTLTLQKAFVDKGFKVTGTLSTPDSNAVCHYKVKVEKGATFELIHECPATQSSTPTACTQPLLCSEILFTSGYDRLRKYQVLVTAVGRSKEVSIDIPKGTHSMLP